MSDLAPNFDLSPTAHAPCVPLRAIAGSRLEAGPTEGRQEPATEKPMKQIALALQESVVLRFSILQGVQDYARTAVDWKLLRSAEAPVLSWEEAFASQPDGIIGFIGAEGLPSQPPEGTPIVCVNSIHDCSSTVRVRSDAHAVGALAARYFLERRYRSFAFCSDVPTHF